jgi:hypothetical protein
MLEKIRQKENLHILLWLIKDTCWVQDYKIAGLFMIVPTISVAVWLTWKMRQLREEFIHNLAVCFWLMANSVWMIGEFFFNDTTRPFALIFFIAGLSTLAIHYVPKWVRQFRPVVKT